VQNNDRKSGFYLLSDNADAFVARIALATEARKTLDIQYYIMHNDASGEYLAYAVLAAADRGVRVRILVDDISLSGRDIRLKMLSQHHDIQIRIFNPLVQRDWFRSIELISNLDRAGRRMHNKAFIADGSSAIIGGRNIGDEYFDDRNRLNFVDLDLLTTGPIVDEITSSFNEYWRSNWATAIEDISKTRVVKKQLTTIRMRLKDKWHRARNTDYFHSLQHSDLSRKINDNKVPFIWAPAKFFYDRPEKLAGVLSDKTTHFGPQIMPYFDRAKNDLLIATPYFVPGKQGSQWLKDKHKQGVSIKILTNSLAATDVIAVHAGYRKYREGLVKNGVKLFELKPTAKRFRSKTKNLIESSSTASLHAKYMVVDQQFVFVGSANLDPRSNALNTEIGVIVDSKELAEQASELFNKTSSADNSYQLLYENSLSWLTREDGKEIRFFQEPNANFLKRIGVIILSLLPFESLL
jgi:putative cardiolipin synthase